MSPSDNSEPEKTGTPADALSRGRAPRLGYALARRVAAVSAVLAVVLSVLLVANYLQVKSVDPLNSPAIARLMTELRDDPEDSALKDDIRALDLLARKAYFTHLWQLRTGSYLLFAFVLVLLLSLKYISSLEPRLPDLSKGREAEKGWEIRLLSRRTILYGGLGLFVVALGLGILSQTELGKIGKPTAEGTRAGAGFPDPEKLRENWPAFRGPEGTGVAHQTDIPLEWDGPSGKNVAWKSSVPLPGYNSPIVWEKRLFLSGADRKSQAVYCFDTDSGEILWTVALDDVPGSPDRRPQVTEDTGFAAPTMTTDGERIFAMFATGDIACLDFEGKRIWARNLGLPDNHYGHASSLITFRDILIVPFDQNAGGRLLGLRTGNGETVYDVAREVGISWASPVLIETGGRTELVLNSNPFVMAHDPATGRELWRVKCMQGEIAPSPAYAAGMVYAVNDYARLVGIKLGDAPEVVWEYLDDLAEVSSPLATPEFVIMAASFGAVTCLDSRTGERLWIEEFPEGFYSSPILVGDNVYLMDFEGVLYIFKAAREYELVSRNELGEGATTIPAFMPGHIYIRGEENLFCIGK